MAEKNPDLPKDSKGWAEYLKNIDYRDHKKAMVGLGAAAAFGVGVGVYALSKKRGGGNFFVRFGDRHWEEKGVISVGESVEGGAAVGLPISENALKRVGSGREIFSMERAEGSASYRFDYPAENEADVPHHTSVLRRFGGMLLDHFRPQETPEQ